MTVKASPKDSSGAQLDVRIAQLTTAAAAINAGHPAAARLAAELDAAQRDAVNHYMEHGRITAAAILSTLT